MALSVTSAQSLQLSTATLCKISCWREHEAHMCTLNGRISGKRSFGKLSHGAGSGKAGTKYGNHGCRENIIAATQTGSEAGASVTLHDDRVDTAFAATMPPDDVHNEDEGHAECTTINPFNAATMPPDDVHHEGEEHDARTTRNPSNSVKLPPDDVHHEGEEHDARTTRNPSNSVKLPPDDVHHEVEGHDACTTRSPPNAVTTSPRDVHHKVEGHDAYTASNPLEAGESGFKGKVRRFSLDQPGFLKTVQEARALTPLEQARLKLLMKFKLTHDSLKGRLVIRAMRTEQLKDLEHLLTDSYSELMWGPFTYRPVLAWILATYLRDRQACLPHAVTLVGLYAPSEEIDDDDSEAPSHKWLLAGAVEISFNASGKPKDLQTPVPPKDAPFLSNMAVLKKFRRRGIGRELLKAAEQLAAQMGCKEMYLHCRLIDEAPLNMYKKSGYVVVETDSILSLLTLQRRRHLMCKTLPAPLCDGNLVQSD